MSSALVASRTIVVSVVFAVAALVASADGHAASSIHHNPARTVTSSTLTFVSVARGSTDVFALGSNQTASGANHQVVLYRHDGHWTTIELRLPPSTTLTGIAATSPSTAWLVGYAKSTVYIGRLSHRSLKRISLKGVKLGELQGVAASSPSNVWVVGESLSRTGSVKTIAARWDGTRWRATQFHVSVSEAAISPYTVATTGPRNTWLTGTQSDQQSVIMHWGGSKWTQTYQGTPYVQSFSSIVASGSGAWVAGQTRKPHGSRFVNSALVMRWTGSTWARVSTRSPGPDSSLTGLADNGSHAFAVGYYSTVKGASEPLLLLLAGHSATRLKGAPAGRAPALVAVASSSRLTIAVGTHQGHAADPAMHGLAESYVHHHWATLNVPD